MASQSFRGLGGWRWRGTPRPRITQRKICSAICAVLAVAGTIAVPQAQSPDRARTEALARRATERLQALQREADRLASEERTILGELRKLEIERQLRAEELKTLDADAAKVEAELAATDRRVQALQSSARASEPELRARLVEIYKLGRARYLRLILATPDLKQLGQATRSVAVLAKLDRDRIASHQQTVSELARTRKMLDQRRNELASLRTAAARAQAAAQRAAQARTELVRDIDQKRDLNAQLAGELQTTQQRLQAVLRDMTTGATALVGETAALPLRPFRGDLPWPVNGQPRRRFTGGTPANGIDITAPEGASAAAIHDGVVAFAGTFAGFGNLVILDHGSQTFSLYGDLLEIAVKKGARVEHGQPIGKVGPTPSGTNALYFELRVDGQPVDPLQWLKKR
jgi:septal ring factor EnvC (AmiA/AmiB activator)